MAEEVIEASRCVEETDPDRQRRARELARISRRTFAVELALGAAALLIYLLSGVSEWLRDRIDLHWAAQAPLVAAIVFAAYGLAKFPLDYYTGYLLPRRYDLLTQSFASWMLDRAKGVAVGGLIALVLIEILYGLLHLAGSWWWVWTAAAYSGVSVLLAVIAPVLLFPIFFKVRPLEDAELLGRIQALSVAAGARVRGAFIWLQSEKGTTANAAVMGLGRTRRVLLSDTLLDRYSAGEIEVVLAHELGHHVHADLPKAVVLQIGVTFLSFFISSRVLDWGVDVFGFRGLTDVAAFPLLVLALAVFGFLVGPAVKAYSRYAENRADVYALETTRRPADFISMMTKLTDQNLGEAEPPRWAKWLFYDHPTYRERVATARHWQDTVLPR